MLPDLETLNRYEEDGWVKSSEGPNGLTVWCYTQKTAVERYWDDVTRVCRGLVYDRFGGVVSRPFPKFHNHGEPEAVVEAGAFVAFDKMDGTLIIVGEKDGDAVTSTKGSFNTWHSEAARSLLLGFVPPVGQTAIFEFIHPENRIVVDYGDYTGLVFLGGIDNETGADLGFPEYVAGDMGWHGDVVTQRSFHLPTMLQTIANPEAGPNREGFVVAWIKDGEPWNRVKLKFDLYVRLHTIYTGLTNRRVWECLMNGTLDELLEIAPDELHADIKEAAARIKGVAEDIFTEAEMFVASTEDAHTRKEWAAAIMGNLERPGTSIAFKLLDEKVDDAWLIALAAARPEVSKFVGSAGLS